MPFLEDFQRHDELVAELIGTAPHEALRGDGRERVVWQVGLAEPRVASPDGDDDARRHAVLLLECRKRRTQLLELAASRGGERTERAFAEIEFRHVEFGLMAWFRLQGRGECRTIGISGIRGRNLRQGPVELQALEICVERFARQAEYFD